MASPTSEENMDIQAPPQPWARSEDDLLRRLAAAQALSLGATGRTGAESQGASDESVNQTWEEIAGQFEGRTAAQCASRYQKVLNPENVKGASPHLRTAPPPKIPKYRRASLVVPPRHHRRTAHQEM